MPVCNTCGEDKGIDQFYRRSDTRKPRGDCIECNNKQARKWKANNEERHRNAVDERYRTFGRFARYGITKEIYDAAFASQDGKCVLCGASEPGGKGEWHIDHAHPPGAVKTGRTGFYQTRDGSTFRGLLCHPCNISLGHFEMLAVRVSEERIMAYRASRFDQSGLASVAWTDRQLKIMGNGSQKELDL